MAGAEARDCRPPGVPSTLEIGEMAFCFNFHEVQPLLAVGATSGAVTMWGLEPGEEPDALHRLTYHTDACRAICFPDEEHFISVSADQSVALVDVNSTKVAWRMQEAHGAAINCVQSVGEASHPTGLIASGDDDGALKLWDVRQRSCVLEFHDHQDFVSSIVVNEVMRMLVSSSGDGTLAAYNLRRGKLELRSDQLEDELLSCALVKNGKLVLCGSQGGVLHTYKWGEWADCSDRIPGHPTSIDCLAVLDEDTVLTGSSDGMVRLCTIQPHKLMGVLGDHGENPIEEMIVRWPNESSAISPLPPMLATTAHDGLVKFWDLSKILAVDDDEAAEDSDSDDNDSSDSSDEDDKPSRPDKRQKLLKQEVKKGAAVQASDDGRTTNESFFDDL